MINISDILPAITGLVKKAFPGEMVYTNRVRQDFVRPSHLVELGKLQIQPENMSYEQRTLDVNMTSIIAVDDLHDSRVETLISRAETILSLFQSQYVKVGDRSITVSNAVCSFEYDFVEVKVMLTWSEEIGENHTVPAAEHYRIKRDGLECFTYGNK